MSLLGHRRRAGWFDPGVVLGHHCVPPRRPRHAASICHRVRLSRAQDPAIRRVGLLLRRVPHICSRP